MKINNAEAHKILDHFNRLCDLFNEGDFQNNVKYKGYLKSCQDDAYRALLLFNFIHEQEPCESSRSYIIFAKKILLRLSCLIHEGRIETDKELTDFFLGQGV